MHCCGLRTFDFYHIFCNSVENNRRDPRIYTEYQYQAVLGEISNRSGILFFFFPMHLKLFSIRSNKNDFYPKVVLTDSVKTWRSREIIIHFIIVWKQQNNVVKNSQPKIIVNETFFFFSSSQRKGNLHFLSGDKTLQDYNRTHSSAKTYLFYVLNGTWSAIVRLQLKKNKK